MVRLRSRGRLAVLAIAILLAAALLALAAGADAASLALGAASMGVAILAILVLAWSDGRHRPHGDRGRSASRPGGAAPGAPQARQAGRPGRVGGPEAARLERHMLEAIEAAELRLFTQLEALDWLRSELQLAHPLPPTRGFAAAPDVLLQLVRLIDRLSPAHVVETGSGVSTIVMARRLQQRGRGRLTSLEHLTEHAQQTRLELSTQGLADVAEVIDAPLEALTLGDATWPWYRLPPELPPAIDLLFVDGPPSGTGPLARYPALPMLHDRLVPGAAILVDDGDRPDEREMVQRWQAEWTDLEVSHLALAKGAWLLELPR
jgi:predicted O-methyltransferase YrrM